MAEFLKRNPKFNMHSVNDLIRLGHLYDKEATMELGIRALEEDFFMKLDANHECNEHCDCPTEAICPECDNEFDID